VAEAEDTEGLINLQSHNWHGERIAQPLVCIEVNAKFRLFISSLLGIRVWIVSARQHLPWTDSVESCCPKPRDRAQLLLFTSCRS
jgi:hypothetical protein